MELSRASEGVDPQEYARARDISEIIDISEKDRGISSGDHSTA